MPKVQCYAHSAQRTKGGQAYKEAEGKSAEADMHMHDVLLCAARCTGLAALSKHCCCCCCMRLGTLAPPF